jgi:DNA-binding transcriptional MerR regulator
VLDNHFQIGEVADRVGLSLRTIRYYEEIGLVRPSGRTEGGFRLYTDPDVDRLHLIKTLKPLGLSLDAMGELMDCVDQLNDDTHTDVAPVARRLEDVVAQALEKCEQLEDRLIAAREALQELSMDPARRTG